MTTNHKKNKKRILIVDDSPEWIKFHRQSIEMFFEKDFFDVDYAFSGKEGLKKATENLPYDIILSDMQMEFIPEETYAGMWMVKRLKNLQNCQNTSIIIISASYEIAQIARILGVDYIPKGSLLNNPEVFHYKITEVLGLESC